PAVVGTLRTAATVLWLTGAAISTVPKANALFRQVTDHRSIPKPSPRSIVYFNSTPSPIDPNQSNLLLKTLITVPALRSMETLHLAQQRFQKPICRAFDSFAPALSPRWAARLCRSRPPGSIL